MRFSFSTFIEYILRFNSLFPKIHSLFYSNSKKIEFLGRYQKINTEMTTQIELGKVTSSDDSDALEKIRNALWVADDSDYWQTGMLLEKGASLGDFVCKFKLGIWLESIDPTKSIDIFEELLITPDLRFDDKSSIHFHLGKLYISRYNWIIAYKHFSDAYAIGDAKIAMGILKHFGLVGIPDTRKAVQCFDEAARRYHYSEKELRDICDRFSTEFKKQQEQEQKIKMQAAEIESQRVKIEQLERQLKYMRHNTHLCK